jgi:hypothetical protein
MRIGDIVKHNGESCRLSYIYYPTLLRRVEYHSTDEIKVDYRYIMVFLTGNTKVPKKVHLLDIWKPLYNENDLV